MPILPRYVFIIIPMRKCAPNIPQINTLGRDVIPIMNNIANLPGGHKPLNFTHILADGSLRHVQTYAGPVVLYNIRLMLCIIHDITEEVHLKKSWNFPPPTIR